MAKLPGIIETKEPKTFDDIVDRINPDRAALENLARQKDDGPIIILNLLRFKPRGDASIYSIYGKEAGPQVKKNGGYILYYGQILKDLDPVLGFDISWDGIVMPLYARRDSFLELQENPLYQQAIPYRVAGSYERLLYVIGDSDTLLDDSTSILEYYNHKMSIAASGDDIYVAELLHFKESKGRQLFKEYLLQRASLIEKKGAKHILSRAAETPIISVQSWDHLLLTRFPSLDVMLDLYQSYEWQILNEKRVNSIADSCSVPTKCIPLPEESVEAGINSTTPLDDWDNFDLKTLI